MLPPPHLCQNWSRWAPSLSCLLWLTTTPPAAQGANANYFRLSFLACNSSHLQLCDHDAAKHAIRRTSRQTPTAQLPLGVALDMAQLPGAPDAHRTGRNIDIADPFSRHDMSLPTQHGWVVLSHLIHALYRWTCRVTGDVAFVHDVVLDDIPELVKFHNSLTPAQLPEAHVSCNLATVRRPDLQARKSVLVLFLALVSSSFGPTFDRS